MVSAKRVLCVGINTFKNLPNATLHGCVNDMSRNLKDPLGFTDTDIVKLKDAQATNSSFMITMRS